MRLWRRWLHSGVIVLSRGISRELSRVAEGCAQRRCGVVVLLHSCPGQKLIRPSSLLRTVYRLCTLNPHPDPDPDLSILLLSIILENPTHGTCTCAASTPDRSCIFSKNREPTVAPTIKNHVLMCPQPNMPGKYSVHVVN